jgi:hypothetical protein
MPRKQKFLTDDQIEGIKQVVEDLMNKGLQGTLKSDAIENNNVALSNPSGRGRKYMSPEQAWATAVISRLLSSGYEIKKRDDS